MTVGDKKYLRVHEVIALLHTRDHLTVNEMAEELEVSIPTALALANQMVAEGVLKKEGTRKTSSGRKPTLYKLGSFRKYAVGVEVLLSGMSLVVVDVELEVIYERSISDFQLRNSVTCLEEVVHFIDFSLQDSGIDRKLLLGVGVGMTGRIDKDGNALNYFNFLDQALNSYLMTRLGLQVFIANDTHCYGLAEKTIGHARGKEDVIVLNIGGGLGTALILNGQLIEGNKGFAGEFGHMQFGLGERICICGKKGCLGTEVSGSALEASFQEALIAGASSLLQEASNVRYPQVLQVALEGDALAISLLQSMGTKLGQGLGNIINLLNPQQVIISGAFTLVKSIIRSAIEVGMMGTALVNPLQGCELVFSDMGPLLGTKGAATLVFRAHGLIK